MTTMNRALLGLCLAIFLAPAFSISAQPSPDHIALTRLLNEFLEGASRNDAAIHDRFWAEDLIYTRSTGVRTKKEELMKGVRSAPARKDSDPVTVYTAEDVQIRLYGDTAVVAFKLVSTTTKPDGAKTIAFNLNTGTFVKRRGTWQAVAWQSTIVPPPQSTTSAAAMPAVSSDKPAAQTPATSTGARTYVKGPRGGCYYLNPSGAKVYVDKKYCP